MEATDLWLSQCLWKKRVPAVGPCYVKQESRGIMQKILEIVNKKPTTVTMYPSLWLFHPGSAHHSWQADPSHSAEGCRSHFTLQMPGCGEGGVAWVGWVLPTLIISRTLLIPNQLLDRNPSSLMGHTKDSFSASAHFPSFPAGFWMPLTPFQAT